MKDILIVNDLAKLRDYANDADLSARLAGSPQSCDDELQPVIQRAVAEIDLLRAFISKMIDDGQWFISAIELNDLDGEDLRDEAVELIGEDLHGEIPK